MANYSCHNMEEVTLNLPGRDAKIKEYLRYIRLLGKAGIHYSTYAHKLPTPDGIDRRGRGSRGRQAAFRYSAQFSDRVR